MNSDTAIVVKVGDVVEILGMDMKIVVPEDGKLRGMTVIQVPLRPKPRIKPLKVAVDPFDWERETNERH